MPLMFAAPAVRVAISQPGIARRSISTETVVRQASRRNSASSLLAQSDSFGIAAQDDASDGAVDVRADGGAIASAPPLAREVALSKRKAARKHKPGGPPLTAQGSADMPGCRSS
jgi:hypothetical protein